jgi:predicted Ser/Thr protein kinase
LIGDISDYGFPQGIRNLLPPTIPSSHNLVKISSSGEITSSHHQLKGVETIWHTNKIDVTTIPVVREMKTGVYKVIYGEGFAVAKIARFEFEVPYIEKETRVYRDIDGRGIGPKFLAHLIENGRTMGFLIEYLVFRSPSKEDLSACIAVLRRLHSLGLVHGDVNRNNFLIMDGYARLIDFDSCAAANKDAVAEELDRVYAELIDESGRGAPRRRKDYEEGQYPIGI